MNEYTDMNEQNIWTKINERTKKWTKRKNERSTQYEWTTTYTRATNERMQTKHIERYIWAKHDEIAKQS